MSYKKLYTTPEYTPIEISTDAEMISALVAANEGKCYKFTGTTGTYTNGDLYVVEKEFSGLKFTANTAGSTVAMSVTGTPTLGQNFSYSTDNSTWTTFTPGTTTVTLTNVGDKVYFKGNNPNGVSESYDIYYNFVMTGSIAASGNIMSLIDNGACATLTVPNAYCFSHQFYNCTSLTTAPRLPATTLTNYCYDYMFHSCTNLTTPPVLPSITLAQSCYCYMFMYCTSLQVYSSSGTGHTCAWRIPPSDTSSSYTMHEGMFYHTTGDYASSLNTTINTTFYTQNTPV